ncbi:Na+/H+ antiporter subunit E [Parahaliea aestuarii]|uniref:Cation transporter n=1 Tax=Parahaliea aestuarii TaxID=1852021 RepID=A0A5C8ZV70_9GAMM|nr:Na+/H+ antiporter subunit E [Parahaliea aestuarii]TXS92388.1 cation transporter [Parahaliea aestuarii]
MRYTLGMAGALALFWLMNSGHYSPLLLTLGAASVVLVTWIARRMDVVDRESMPLHLLSRVPRYFLWLSGQIIASNLDLVRQTWSRNPDYEPQVARLPLPQQSDICRVVYANSINLTPGTLTVEISADHLLVHSLSARGMASLEGGEMSRRVSELEQ